MNADFTEVLAAWLIADPTRIQMLKALSDEVASDSAACEAGFASANGCRGAHAPSNHEADSSVRCRDKAGLAAAVELEITYLDKEIKLLRMESLRLDGSRRSDDMRRAEMRLLLTKLRLKRALAADSAAPSGQRARLDNDQALRPRTPGLPSGQGVTE